VRADTVGLLTATPATGPSPSFSVRDYVLFDVIDIEYAEIAKKGTVPFMAGSAILLAGGLNRQPSRPPPGFAGREMRADHIRIQLEAETGFVGHLDEPVFDVRAIEQ
jgi:hypothetical protein